MAKMVNEEFNGWLLCEIAPISHKMQRKAEFSLTNAMEEFITESE